MKKICFFSGDITRSGGTERVGTVIANELHKKGQFEISIVSLWEDKKKTFFHLEQGIKRDTLFSDHISGKRILTYVKAVRKYVENNQMLISPPCAGKSAYSSESAASLSSMGVFSEDGSPGNGGKSSSEEKLKQRKNSVVVP